MRRLGSSPAVAAAVFGLSVAPAAAIEPLRSFGDPDFAPRIAMLASGSIPGCTATLIDRRWLLTAKHCVGPDESPCETPYDTTVVLDLPGRRDIRFDAIPVEESICHPDGDLALLRIKSIFRQDRTQPLLGNQPVTAGDGSAAAANPLATSWVNGKPFGASVHALEMAAAPRSVCSKLLEDKDDCQAATLTVSQFCARSPGVPAGFYGLQQGDSGSPLVLLQPGSRERIVGVASQACRTTGVTVFEDVSFYRDWIVEKVCAFYGSEEFSRVAWRRDRGVRLCRERALAPPRPGS